jgi:predicted TIM-barrel enzyme
VIDEQLLRESKLIRGHFAGIKILGDGEVKNSLNVQVAKISTSAREKIEKAGGTVTLIEGRKIGGIETDVASPEAKPDVAAKTTKSRTKRKTKPVRKSRE